MLKLTNLLLLAVLVISPVALGVESSVAQPVQQVIQNLGALYNTRSTNQISAYLNYILDDQVVVEIKSSLVDFNDMSKVLDVQQVTMNKQQFVSYQSSLNNGYTTYIYTGSVSSASDFTGGTYLAVVNSNEQASIAGFNNSNSRQNVYISTTCNYVFRNAAVNPIITGLNCYEKIAKVVSSS